MSSFRRLLGGEIGSYRLDVRLIGKDGSAIWIDCYVATTAKEAGAPWTALVMVQDITSRKLAEVGLLNENARLSRVVEIQAEIAATQLELEAASHLIAERAQELTSADGATVNILDGDELVAQAVVGSTTGPASNQRPAAPRRTERRLAQRHEGSDRPTRIAARSSCSRSSSPRR